MEMDIDEVDGEAPAPMSSMESNVEPEKTMPDSGMEEGNASTFGSMETGADNSEEEEEEIVLKKSKKNFSRILDDDDSDASQDVAAVVEDKKQEMTAEEVLEAVMKESDDDNDDKTSDTETSQERKKKKKLKRAVMEDSSDDEVESASLMDCIKNSTTGASDLFDTEEQDDDKRSSDVEDGEKVEKKKNRENLFDADSDSSGGKSSGSEVEKSDNERDDEGFDESSIDPKLLAKLKKGAAKKPRDSSRRSKKEEKIALHSETQRMIRESRVNIPYHQPAPRSLNDFLARASKKQQEYKVLKGFRDSRKVKVVEQVLQKARIQNKAKTQEELDKYSDSDDDWNPDDIDDRTLKERIDAKMAKDGKISDKTDEANKGKADETNGKTDTESNELETNNGKSDESKDKTVTGSNEPFELNELECEKLGDEVGASGETLKKSSESNEQINETKDLDDKESEDKVNDKVENSSKSTEKKDTVKDNVNKGEKADRVLKEIDIGKDISDDSEAKGDDEGSDDFDDLPDLEIEIETKDSNADDGTEDNENIKDSVNETEDNSLMFEWEKTSNQTKGSENRSNENNDITNETDNGVVQKDIESAKINENSNSPESEIDPSEENKENIDPNGEANTSHNAECHSESIEKPDELSDELTTSPEQKTTPKKNASTTTQKHSASKTNSGSKKRKKIAALVGIDLDSVKPCLSGDTNDVICLEAEEAAPRHPGVQNLMDRLTRHSKKVEHKKKKDTAISVISKDSVGIDKEELHLNTFTYHAQEDEENPLLKLETPGAKLVALKEQLQEKMKERREQARQKRQELYNLDNEEGGEEEEEEMSERSDTDEEANEEVDEEEGEIEDEDEGDELDEYDEMEEGEREKNPFADDEAEDDDADDDDDINLKLEMSDEESGDMENEESNEKSSPVQSKPTTPPVFKEPKGPEIAEKPFSMFGKEGSSFGTSQIQSGQRARCMSIPMPIEDSQDLCGSMLPDIPSTQSGKTSQQNDDFSFLLEDSQSNMLDAEGFLKTKSSTKKKPALTSFNSAESLTGTQATMDELFGLCSGKFADGPSKSEEKISRKSLFEEESLSNSTQGNLDELKAFCSGVFADKTQASQSQKKDHKRKTGVGDDDDDDDDSTGVYSDTEQQEGDADDDTNDADNANDDSDDDGADEDDDKSDNERDTDHLDSDEDEDNEEERQKFIGFVEKKKKGKIRQEFVDEEAELSGSEGGSDEDLDLAEEEDIMELEEGDKDVANMDKDKLRDEVGRVHFKQMIDEDKRELLRFQEMYLPDGDLYSEGGGRMRRFRWSNMDDDTQQDMFDSGGSDNEVEHEDTDDFQWRKERYEREKFIKEQKEKEKEEEQNDSQFMKFGKVFLKKQASLDSSSTEKEEKIQTSASDTPGFPGSFMKLPEKKRGSFLARSKEALARIAEMTKPAVNPSAGAKSSGKFTFSVISPGKDKAAEESKAPGKQRKAHVPKRSASVNLPPAKKPKLETSSSFTQNSIFHHL